MGCLHPIRALGGWYRYQSPGATTPTDSPPEDIAALDASERQPTTSIAPPGGAIEVGGWVLDNGKARGFKGTKRGSAMDAEGKPVRVEIDGDQFVDGAIHRYIGINGEVFLDCAAMARELAADILAAADEMEALAD